MSDYFDAFREAIIAAHAEGGSLRLRGAQIGVSDLRDLAGRLNAAADAAVASRPKSENEQWLADRAAEGFASFAEDCKLWVELTDTDSATTAERLAEIAEARGLDVDDLASFEFEADPDAALTLILDPLSMEVGGVSCPTCGEDSSTEMRFIICTGGPGAELCWPEGRPEEAQYEFYWSGRVKLDPTPEMLQLAQWLQDQDNQYPLFERSR